MTKAAELAKMGEVLTNSQIGGRRNIILNPKMAIAQRGTSASSKTTSDYFTCDRWRTEASGATYNTSQQTNSASDMATTGAEHFLRMEVTTANNNSGISQKIEAQNIKQFKGEKLTLSFYAKGTNPNGGSFDVVRQFDDGSAASTQEKSSLTVTSSFVKYTYTFDYPDEGSVTMTDANAKMALSFLQPDGDSSTNAWTLDITSVQLEVGEKATPFEHRSFGEELQLCKRYFQKVGTDNGSLGAMMTMFATRNSTNQALLCYPCPVPLRTIPSITQNGSYTLYGSGQSISLGSILANGTNQTLFQQVTFSATATGISSGNSSVLYGSGSDCHFTFDSEL